MSRNKQEGRYAGKLGSKHYRTRSASVSVSTLDCVLHTHWKDVQRQRRIAMEMLNDGMFGGLGRIVVGWL